MITAVVVLGSKEEGDVHVKLPLLFQDFEEIEVVLGNAVSTGSIKKVFFIFGGKEK